VAWLLIQIATQLVGLLWLLSFHAMALASTGLWLG
jgi:hypothetical protein